MMISMRVACVSGRRNLTKQTRDEIRDCKPGLPNLSLPCTISLLVWCYYINHDSISNTGNTPENTTILSLENRFSRFQSLGIERIYQYRRCSFPKTRIGN